MGLFGSAGLKSAASSVAQIVAALVGQTITALRFVSSATSGPAYTSNVNAGQYAFFDTSSNGGWVAGTNTATLQVAGANTIALSSTAVTLGVSRSLSFASFSDGSGTPGNATNNNARGKNAIAAGAASVTITNSMVAAASSVYCVLETADATATTILRCIPAAGSFALTVNANATGNVVFSFIVFN